MVCRTIEVIYFFLLKKITEQVYNDVNSITKVYLKNNNIP